MSKRVAIIGGGVIGLATAWYCQQRGHQVVVIDRNGPQRDGCSFGNAGMIVPSHFIPLAAPGMVRLGLRWLWNPWSPFAIRPRASWELLAWLWRFQRSCSRKHVLAAAPLLRDMHMASRQCFVELDQQIPGGIGLAEKGLVMLCKGKPALDEETETAELAAQLGVQAEVMDGPAISQLDPNIETTVLGGVYYPRDCYLSPTRLMSALQTGLADQGCEFRWQSEWTGFECDRRQIRVVQTTAGPIEADEIVLCGGVWSPKIARQLRLSLPMQAGKGYSLTLDQPRQLPSLCSILTEARVAVTPMGSSLRFGGTMEIAGIDQSISRSRVLGITRSINRYFPRFCKDDFSSCKPWVGLRPCSPDGLPYLGRSSRWDNLVVATGHAMLGISLAMISGRLAAETMDGVAGSLVNHPMLSPDRCG